MDVVDGGIYEVLIFCGVGWIPLVGDGVFDLGYVALGTRFLCGVGVPVLVSSLDLSGTGPSFSIHLGFVPHGDVLDLCNLFLIILIQLPSCS